jgi:hypothetical protein
MRELLVLGFLLSFVSPAWAELQVGAAKVDVTPDQLPVLINGSMTSHSAEQIKTRVHARAIVMDDGQQRNPTVRANMHSAVDPLQAIGPTGPEDPQLSIIAFETLEGKPIAALANFSMHYFGDSPISADYFGLFCDGLEKHMHASTSANSPAANSSPAAGKKLEPDPVAIMSHGCSGDIWKKDYLRPQAAADGTIDEFTQGLLSIAKDVYDQIELTSAADLAMQEARLPLRYRTPDAQRLQWSEQIVAEMGDRLPQTLPEIYAREQLFLHSLQTTELILQAIRIGDIAIVSTPNETYALTGLKLKLQSPTTKTMVIELANGSEGYIPPPEQHVIGGYNTWAARSAGLETTAEPKIVATNLLLLEQTFQRPRREFKQSSGPAAHAIAELKPVAYWRLNEFSGPIAEDASGNGRNATFEPGVLFFLEGPTTDAEPAALGPWNSYTESSDINRCAHFAGGRIVASLPALTEDFSVALTFWNGMPGGVRPVAGWMLSRDHDYATSAAGLHLGVSGATDSEGKLILQVGELEPLMGRSATPRWKWGKAVLVKSANKLSVYQGSAEQAEMEMNLPENWGAAGEMREWFFGGRSDSHDNWEGKLDEIAVFDFALKTEELRRLLQ